MVSNCARPNCRTVAHVLLFAREGDFDGLTYRKGEAVAFCLKHGGEIYDAIRIFAPTAGSKRPEPERLAGWIYPFRGQLPQPWADHHIRPGARPNTWNRPGRFERTRAPR